MQAKRRWFQFSLRSLFVVMLVLPMVLGVYARYRARAQRKWEAVRAIEKAGGSFVHHIAVVSEQSMRSQATPWQRCLEIDLPYCNSVIVDEFHEDGETFAFHLQPLQQLENVALRGDWVDDKPLKVISGFPKLNCLEINSDEITDAGVLCFTGNKTLQKLYLSGEKLTDHGMAVVAQLPELRYLTWQSGNTTGGSLVNLRNHPRLNYLFISGAMASDIGFEHLSTCAKLEDLHVDGPNALTSNGIRALARLRLKHLCFKNSPLSRDAVAALSDLTTLISLTLTGPLSAEDLSALSPLTSLEDLALEDCKLTGDALKRLVSLKQLKSLDVNMTELGDEDMELLATFTNLRRVDLSHSVVTDAGLMKLVVMQNLWQINIKRTKVTAEGVKEFRLLVPGLFVVEGDPSN